MFSAKTIQANAPDTELLSLRLHINFCRALNNITTALRDFSQELNNGSIGLQPALTKNLIDLHTACYDNLFYKFKKNLPEEFKNAAFNGQIHDYSNMIQVLASVSDMMLAKIHDENIDSTVKRADFKKKVGYLEKYAHNCHKLIEKIWDQGFKNSAIDLSEIIMQVKSMMEIMLEKNHISLVTDFDLAQPVRVNPVIFHRVLTNLIQNSVEAFPKNYDQPKFIMVVVNQRDNHLSLCVTDNGTGMAPEVLQNISQKNYSTKTSQSVHDHGWGLSSVRHLVQELHGNMLINSTHNQPFSGTRVQITVPF